MTARNLLSFRPRNLVLGLAGTGVLVAVAVAAAGNSSHQPVPVQAAQPIQAFAVAFEPESSIRRYTGVVRPRYESDLGFRVAGKVIARAVNTGDAVKAGATIAELDPTDFRLAVEAAEAELSAAKSSRDSLVADEARYRTLNEKGHVAQAALDQKISAADEARARVERAERSLETQKNQLSYAVLKADRDGVVTALPVEAGQVVAAGQTVARVARLDELEAVVAVPEQLVSNLSEAKATIRLWPETEKSYTGRLREVDADADAVARTFDARFSILKADADVRLGRTATLQLSSASQQSVAEVPLAAVMHDADGAYVWVIDSSGDRVSRRPVTVKDFTQQFVRISAGLANGDRIVALGAHRIDPAVAVRVIENKTVASRQTSIETR